MLALAQSSSPFSSVSKGAAGNLMPSNLHPYQQDMSSSQLYVPDGSSILDTTVGSLPDIEARILRAEQTFLESATREGSDRGVPDARAVAVDVLRALRQKAELLVFLDQLRDLKRRLEAVRTASPSATTRDDADLDAAAAADKLLEAERDEAEAGGTLLQLSDLMRARQDFLARFLPVSALEEALGRILVLYLSSPGTHAALSALGDVDAAALAQAQGRASPAQAWPSPLGTQTPARAGGPRGSAPGTPPRKETAAQGVQTEETGRLYADLTRQVFAAEAGRSVVEADLANAKAALSEARRLLTDAETRAAAAVARVEELEVQLEASRILGDKDVADADVNTSAVLQEFMFASEPEANVRAAPRAPEPVPEPLQAAVLRAAEAQLADRDTRISELQAETALLRRELASLQAARGTEDRITALVEQIQTAVGQVSDANARLDDFRRSIEDDLLSFMEQANSAHALALEVNNKGTMLKEGIDLVLTESRERPRVDGAQFTPRALGFGSPVGLAATSTHEATVLSVADAFQKSLQEFDAELKSSPRADEGRETVLGAGDQLSQALADRQAALTRLREHWGTYAAKLGDAAQRLVSVSQQIDACDANLRRKEAEEREIDARLLEKYEELNEVQSALIEMAEGASLSPTGAAPDRTPPYAAGPTPRSLQHLPTSVALRWAGDASSNISGSEPITRDVSPIPGFEEPEHVTHADIRGFSEEPEQPAAGPPRHASRGKSVRFSGRAAEKTGSLSVSNVEIFTQTTEASAAVEDEEKAEALQLLPTRERRLRALETTAAAQLRQLHALQQENLTLRQELRKRTANGAAGQAGFDALRLDRVYEEAAAELERVEEEVRVRRTQKGVGSMPLILVSVPCILSVYMWSRPFRPSDLPSCVLSNGKRSSSLAFKFSRPAQAAASHLMEAESRRAQAEAQAAQAEQTYEIRSRAVEETETELRSLHELLEGLRHECTTQQGEVRRCLLQCEDAGRRRSALEAEASAAQATLTDLDAQIARRRAELHDVEAHGAAAQTSLLRLGDAVAAAERKLAATDGRVEAIAAQIAELEAQRQGLEAERRELAAATDALAAELRTKRADLSQAETELAAVGAARVAEESQLAHVRATLVATTTEARELAELVEALSEQVSDLQQQRYQLLATAGPAGGVAPSDDGDDGRGGAGNASSSVAGSPSARRTLFAQAAAPMAGGGALPSPVADHSISVSAVLEYSESHLGAGHAAASRWAGIVAEKDKTIRALESELRERRQREALQGALSAASMLASPARSSPQASSVPPVSINSSAVLHSDTKSSAQPAPAPSMRLQDASTESSPSLGLKPSPAPGLDLTDGDSDSRSRLVAEITSLREERDAAAQRLDRLFAEMERASSDLERVRAELGRAATEERARKGELATLLAAVESARRVHRLHVPPPEALSERPDPPTADLGESSGRQQLENVQQRIDGLRGEARDLETTVTRARSELQSLRSAIDGATLDRDVLKESVAGLERRRATLTADLQNLEKRVNDAPRARPLGPSSADEAAAKPGARNDEAQRGAAAEEEERWSKAKKAFVRRRNALDAEMSRLESDRDQLRREVRRSRMALYLSTLLLQRCTALGKAVRCIDAAMDLSVGRRNVNDAAGAGLKGSAALTERAASDLKPCLEWVQRHVRHLARKAEEALDLEGESTATQLRLPDVETLLRDARASLEALGVSLPAPEVETTNAPNVMPTVAYGSAPKAGAAGPAVKNNESGGGGGGGSAEAEIQRMQRRLDKVGLLLKVKDAQIVELRRRAGVY